MAKNKLVIKKRDLAQVRLNINKYYNIVCDAIVEDSVWEEWKKSCNKAFKTKSPKEYQKLKDISRDLRHEPLDTWVKVYKALGYEVE